MCFGEAKQGDQPVAGCLYTRISTKLAAFLYL